MSRSNAVALAASVAFAVSVSACATLFHHEPEPPLACYWLSNVTNQWQAMPQVQARQQCYELDSCSGGLGMSGGGCYKWSRGPDGPQGHW
jgi:hypothetical protein